MHNPNTTLRRRFAAVTRPGRARAYSFAVATLCAATALSILAYVQAARARSPHLQQARYVIQTRETSTFYVGRQGTLNFVLLDRGGNRMGAPADLKVTVTVTTLESLEEAKAALGRRQQAPPRAAAARRLITLARGQKTVEFTFTHRRGEQDEAVYLLSNQPGRLHIFAECDNVATGETAVVVLARKAVSEAAPPAAVFPRAAWRIVPAAMQDEVTGRYKLDLVPSRTPRPQPGDDGEQIAAFKVALVSVRDNIDEEAPQDIRVILRVEEGYAHFIPDTLVIPKGEAMSKDQAELRTRPGGEIRVNASTASRIHNARVIPVSRSYPFPPGAHSTRLHINKQRESAYANGLDEIELQVVALLPDGRAIPPEKEGMDERRITLGFKGDSQGVKFENGRGEIVIPKGQVAGSIKLFSARSVSDLRVVAESWNGLRNKIDAGEEGTPVSFSFPWLQLLLAMIGGVTLPLLRRQMGWGIAQGLVVGVIFFGLALFGAVSSNPQKLGDISVTLTKLPTENALASYILGFLGSFLLISIFFLKDRWGPRAAAGPGGGPSQTARKKAPATAKADDVRAAPPVETVGVGDSGTRKV